MAIPKTLLIERVDATVPSWDPYEIQETPNCLCLEFNLQDRTSKTLTLLLFFVNRTACLSTRRSAVAARVDAHRLRIQRGAGCSLSVQILLLELLENRILYSCHPPTHRVSTGSRVNLFSPRSMRNQLYKI